MTKKINILPLVCTFLVVTGIHAQTAPATPKLVVSIVVDQLRGDYLQYFASTFGEKGFKRLANEGLTYQSVEFGFPNVSQASSVASIYTGTYPYYNGITGDYKFDVAKNQEVTIVADDNFMGNYTSDRVSPLALLASTVGDELKVASQNKSLVYAIAPNAVEAILSGGRYASAAFWLDNFNGKWATSTYYKDVPYYVDRFNSNEAIGNYSERAWNQSHTHYIGLPYSGATAAFAYNFTQKDKDRYAKIKQTSLINSEITELAGKFLENAGLGNRGVSDLLAITYYAGNYPFQATPDNFSYEIQDIYYRLDKEVEKLLDMLDRHVGLKNVVVVLTSTGYYDTVNRVSSEFKPIGEFYPNRCTALLNMYLMAMYGQENWVTGYYNRQIYLNKKVAEDKQVKWNELVRSAAEFVAQFSGVQDVTTAGEWMIDDAGRSVAFRRGMHKKLSGDIFLELQPGWVVVNENTSVQKEPVRETAILAPLYFFGAGIKKEQVTRKVKAIEIAPTLSYILRIRPPNGCKALPLQEFTK
jgi:hypothetical protein